jgi:2Fe-2S ferredoxin
MNFRLGDVMTAVVFVKPDGSRLEIEAAYGESAMQAATGNLVPGIIGECGGEVSCATCHVFVDEEWIDRLPVKSDDEIDMLESTAVEPTEKSRLSCQIKLVTELDGIVLNVPTEQR